MAGGEVVDICKGEMNMPQIYHEADEHTGWPPFTAQKDPWVTRRLKKRVSM
jgi:hypothetical protein